MDHPGPHPFRLEGTARFLSNASPSAAMGLSSGFNPCHGWSDLLQIPSVGPIVFLPILFQSLCSDDPKPLLFFAVSSFHANLSISRSLQLYQGYSCLSTLESTTTMVVRLLLIIWDPLDNSILGIQRAREHSLVLHTYNACSTQ